MLFPNQMLNHIHIKFLPSINNSRICLKKEMWTPCLNINHMIAPLVSWKEYNLHSDPFIICYKTNYNASWIPWWKPQEGVHLTFEVFS
jgi:hypothetical protein